MVWLVVAAVVGFIAAMMLVAYEATRDHYPGNGDKEPAYRPRLSTRTPGEAFDGGTRMSKAERIKEEIGWLKVVFALAVALDASLLAWLAQNYETARGVIVAGGAFAAVILAGIVAYVDRVAHRRLAELEDA